MSSVSIAGDTSGSILLAAPAVAGSSTLTLPTTGGTVLSNTTPGTILQVVQGSSTNQINTNTNTWVATGVTASITPRSTTSKIFVTCSGNWNTQSNTLGPAGVSIFRNGTNLGDSLYGFTWIYVTTGGDTHFPTTVTNLDSPSSTSSVTYDIRVRSNYGGTGNARWNYASTAIYIILMEVAA